MKTKIYSVSSHTKGAMKFDYGDGNYLSIIIGQYSHTDNYALEDVKDNRNLITTTLEVMCWGNKAMRAAKQKKYEYYADVNKEYVLLNWLPADFLPQLMQEIEKESEQ